MPDELDNLSSAEIGNIIDDKNKELSLAIKANDVVVNEDLRYSKAILTLQLKRKDIQQAINKSKSSIKILALEIKSLTNRFWKARHAGL
jgi:peptidoglycan hydrolase CwlO-like protein